MIAIRHSPHYLLFLHALVFLWLAPFTVRAESAQYDRLSIALTRYQAFAAQGGWTPLPEGTQITPGMNDPRIPLIRKRLEQEGFLAHAGTETVYDPTLVAVIRAIQATHGFSEDGIIDKRMIHTFNVPVAKRIRQLTLNRDRWKELPDKLGPSYIFINIPAYELHAVHNGKSMLMKIIAGRRDRQTPRFNSVITGVIFHPYWHVPLKLTKEKLTKIKKDPSYLIINDFEIVGRDGKAVNPSAVDWSKITTNYFPYTLRQKPGTLNALGQIRFNIKNDFDIYMHGTPDQNLFTHDRRAFSSGCMRVESPLQLAYFIFQGTPGRGRKDIDELYQKTDTTNINLPKPLPIYITYFTNWVDSKGRLQFRDDIYGLDR